LGDPSGRSTAGPPVRAGRSKASCRHYGPACFSEIELHNLSDRDVTVELEGHRASGALVGLAGLPGNVIRLVPHQRGTYKLEIREETDEAWVKVRERAPPDLAPAGAVGAARERISGDQLRRVRRDVAFPRRNPWFDSDISSAPEGELYLINTMPEGALVSLCYSMGKLYSVAGRSRRDGDLSPICSQAFDLLIPAYGACQFPIERDGSLHFFAPHSGFRDCSGNAAACRCRHPPLPGGFEHPI
jgi:hypothetical protein